MKEVKREVRGYRDMWFSNYHRSLGWDAPAIDLDLLLVEYTHNRPVAIVEAKCCREKPLNKKGSGAQTLIALADRASLPAFLVVYNDSPIDFVIEGLNMRGKELLQALIDTGALKSSKLNDQEYREFMEIIREIH